MRQSKKIELMFERRLNLMLLEILIAFLWIVGFIKPVEVLAINSADGMYAYELNGTDPETITITNRLVPADLSGHIVIPDMIDGYMVTVIGPYAFSDIYDENGFDAPGTVSNSIRSVVIPDCVISIVGMIDDYRGAFSQCRYLTNVTFGSGLKTIGAYAFYETGLEHVVIPDNVTSIESNAFMYTSLQSVIIGDGVTYIGEMAFSLNYELGRVVFGSSIETIDAGAFMKTGTNLDIVENNDIIFPDSLRTIGSNAFEEAQWLTAITTPEDLILFGSNAFKKNENLIKATINGGQMNQYYGILSDCYKLESIVVGKKVRSLYNFAKNCNSLLYAVIPDTVTSISNSTFINSSPDFIIWGEKGSEAEDYAFMMEMNFLPFGVSAIYLQVPEISNKKEITISGLTTLSCKEVQISINDNVVDIFQINGNNKFSGNILLPDNGIYSIKAETVGLPEVVFDTKIITCDTYLPSILEFNYYSVEKTIGLLDNRAMIFLYNSHRKVEETYEVKLETTPGYGEILETWIIFMSEDMSTEWLRLPAIYDPVKDVWIASKTQPSIDSEILNGGFVAVECTWAINQGSNLTEGLGEPTHDSRLLTGTGLTAKAWEPRNNSANGFPKVNPNSGTHNLAPGLTVKTTGGNQQWSIVADESAVGNTYVLWAQGNSIGEYIFVTFDQPGEYLIGTGQGMNHLALVRYAGGEKRIHIIDYIKYRYVIDPAGYVYEAVPSNRLSGVTATAYFNESIDSNELVLWDAEFYDQENPLITDKEGKYAWDTPIGQWQIKYELDGYETRYSDWMPVPPEQMEVNVGLVSKAAPVVEYVSGYSDGIEIAFSKYMNLDSLTNENFIVTDEDGDEISGTIEFINKEWNYDPKTNEYAPQVAEEDRTEYASMIRFVPDDGQLSGDITILIDKSVTSYSGVTMDASYTQTFHIKPKPTKVIAEDISIPYYEMDYMTIQVVPAEAGVGMKVTATSESPFIADTVNGILEFTLDENGEALIPINGNMTGKAMFTVQLEDTQLQDIAEVEVDKPVSGQVQNNVEVPFISVNSIANVLDTATAGIPLPLSGTVLPISATNKSVTWSIIDAGNTGADVVSDTILSTTSAGTVVVRATVTNGQSKSSDYTKDFTITVNESQFGEPVFIPVNNIEDIPNVVTGSSITLKGSVIPDNATNTDIKWSIVSAGGTGAVLQGSTLKVDSTGTVVVRATIVDGKSMSSDYVKEFTIKVNVSKSDNSEKPTNPPDETKPTNPSDETKPTNPPDETKPTNPPDETKPTNPPDETKPTNYKVTIVGSYSSESGEGFYTVGDIVTIRAGSRNNYSFDGWTASGVTLTSNRATTTFVMPSHAVTITADWRRASSSGGGGSSSGGNRGTSSKPSDSNSTPASPSNEAQSGGRWTMDKNGWYYQNPNNTYPADSWQLIGEEWYYFDSTGYAQTGWMQDKDGTWYYMDKTNADMKTGWLFDPSYGSWYYLESNGAMKTGWVYDPTYDSWYYLDSSGAMLENQITPDGYQVDVSGRWIQ